jgi:hypothetical protein
MERIRKEDNKAVRSESVVSAEKRCAGDDRDRRNLSQKISKDLEKALYEFLPPFICGHGR